MIGYYIAENIKTEWYDYWKNTFWTESEVVTQNFKNKQHGQILKKLRKELVKKIEINTENR